MTDILVTNVDVDLLRQQHDELAYLVEGGAGGESLAGLLNLLDWMLDEAEGVPHP